MLLILIFIALIFLTIYGFEKLANSKLASWDKAEIHVERSIQRLLGKKEYIVFGNLIIPSSSNIIKSTQIDHVVISRYGIFCLKTKSHKGSISVCK